jgi:hypothetical protein
MILTRLDPIVVQPSRYGAPGQFLWQGKTYPIDVIDRIWRSSPGRRAGVRVYRVRSRGRRFTLRYDRQRERWALVRAPWRTRLGLVLERLAARIAV